MYLRKTVKTVHGKAYENYLLVESVATPNGPRQRTVCSLGNLAPRPAEEWLALAHKVETALLGQADLFESTDSEVREIVEKARRRRARRADQKPEPSPPDPSPQPGSAPHAKPATRPGKGDLVAVHTDRVTVEKSREAGPVHVGLAFWNRLGMDGILAEAGLSKAAIGLTRAMTLNRLIAPASEHAMPDWIRRTALADLVGETFETLGPQPLYRQMDRLHPLRARIESGLVARERDLFDLDTTVYFYDLTSTYFEGAALQNPKAQRGYSRDSRPDAKQVVVGLAINRDGVCYDAANDDASWNAPWGPAASSTWASSWRRLPLPPWVRSWGASSTPAPSRSSTNPRGRPAPSWPSPPGPSSPSCGRNGSKIPKTPGRPTTATVSS